MDDVFVELSADERAVYEAVEDYISHTYAVGIRRAAERRRVRDDRLPQAGREQLRCACARLSKGRLEDLRTPGQARARTKTLEADDDETTRG